MNEQHISVFDMFSVGVGPSSSHTLGPWRAAADFAERVRCQLERNQVLSLHVDLFGSLAKTGRGHGTDLAVTMGLAGEDPATCDTHDLVGRFEATQQAGRLRLGGITDIPFPADHILFHKTQRLPAHPNGMRFTAHLAGGQTVASTYYSLGGGFIQKKGVASAEAADITPPPYPCHRASDLLSACESTGLRLAEVVRKNEETWHPADDIDPGLFWIWNIMRTCIHRGCHTRGILPGGLNVQRRAADLAAGLLPATVPLPLHKWQEALTEHAEDFSDTLKWVSAFALAVNEENAAFGRVVTAPTNGAAGVIPSVLMTHLCFGGGSDEDIAPFLLVAGAVGTLFKQGATISAAMGGCQAEIGVSSAMAAAGLAEVRGGTPGQVLEAAEIAMEHHLGMTCDPIGGLVQIPCIERNAMGAIKAITAAEMALQRDPGFARVSLDDVVATMWRTAQDMDARYKETAEGGLAVQFPVNLSEC